MAQNTGHDEEHIKKVRRRIEDFLRKASPDAVLRIAKALKINID